MGQDTYTEHPQEGNKCGVSLNLQKLGGFYTFFEKKKTISSELFDPMAESNLFRGLESFMLLA